MKVLTEARREAILAAAKAVFEEVGFEQATMSEITARVGGSKATLYRYFRSKEALFMELLRHSAKEHGGELMELFCSGGPNSGLPPVASQVLAVLNPDEDARLNLQHFGELVIKTFLTPQKIAVKRLVIAAVSSHPALGQLFYENGPKRGMSMLEAYFEDAIRSGKLRQADPRIAAIHFRALLESEWVEPGMYGIELALDDDAITTSVKRAVDTFMLAYGPAAA